MVTEKQTNENNGENKMTSLIAKNIVTGDYIEHLGTKGEYPYSSSVGRLVCIGGEVYEYWYPTEINPRGKTELELDTEYWLSMIQPTSCMFIGLTGFGRAAIVNHVGAGVPLNDSYGVGEILWLEGKGYLTSVTPEDRAILDIEISKLSPLNDEDEDDEYDIYPE